MTDIRPYLEVSDPVTDFIKARIFTPRLDGITTKQRRAELDTFDTTAQMMAKQAAEIAWRERQRRDHVLEAAGRMRAGAVGADIRHPAARSATVL